MNWIQNQITTHTCRCTDEMLLSKTDRDVGEEESKSFPLLPFSKAHFQNKSRTRKRRKSDVLILMSRRCIKRCKRKTFTNKEEISERTWKTGMPIFPIHNLIFFSSLLVLYVVFIQFSCFIWLWTNYCLRLRTQDVKKPVFMLPAPFFFFFFLLFSGRCDAMHLVQFSWNTRLCISRCMESMLFRHQ